ncbi:hypothetical protein QBC35DRAFT_480055 [Podospora australis]|uniref:Large ribosomal subunit protein uL23m n=1 Tax=Podospora australis TaxID=1536484 RepID=A0AAN6X4J0_9PEZI|nr:hypothetical protein QBC35DRAFT_480055 [Podospora australis]
MLDLPTHQPAILSRQLRRRYFELSESCHILSNMATQAAATTITEAAARLPRRFGNKQLFLPNHVIAFIRPKPKQPPNLATFVVPLSFNKLDLADYLHHAYNVDVLSVRSFINQKAPVRKNGFYGKWYRPRSEKMMIAELAKPFVWPDAPSEEAKESFDYGMFKKMSELREKQTQKQINPGTIPLRTTEALPKERRALKQQAKDLLEKKVEWSNGKEERRAQQEEELEVIKEDETKP